ncbi:MAG: signal peptidase I [Anaerolineae bacterium]
MNDEHFGLETPADESIDEHTASPWYKPLLRLLRDIVEAGAMALFLFVLLQATVQNTVVEGQSMEPNLMDGQRLLVNKLAYRFGEPARGDIVVIKSPRGTREKLIKRIVGLPGEMIELRGGRVYINGRQIEEYYHPNVGMRPFPPTVIPPDHYFLLGDNRDHSGDSRVWGSVSNDLIIGRVWVSLWPPDRWDWYGWPANAGSGQ